MCHGRRSSTLFRPMSRVASFQDFKLMCVDDIVAAVRALPDKSCASDPLPMTWLKAVVDVIGPFLTHLFNYFLSTWHRPHSPEAFETAYISPLLKKSDMDSADTRSYRPISNLSVVSKVLPTHKRTMLSLPMSVTVDYLQ